MKKTTIAFLTLFTIFFACKKPSSDYGPKEGEPGSLARLVQANNYLYLIKGKNLDVYQVSSSGSAILQSTTPIDFIGAADTIYNAGNYLFAGNSSRMYMFDISAADSPQLIGEAGFLAGCKQLYMTNNAAYTFRSINTCYNPTGVWVYDFANGISSIPPLAFQISPLDAAKICQYDHYLYIAARNEGLQVFDISGPLNPTFVNSINGYDFTNCFIYNNQLLSVIEGGIIVYSLQNPETPEQVASFYN